MEETLGKKVEKDLQVAERLLIAVGPSQDMDKVIRTVKEMADNFPSTLFAVYVEDPGMLRRPDKVRNQAIYNLRLAEALGMRDHYPQGRQHCHRNYSVRPPTTH